MTTMATHSSADARLEQPLLNTRAGHTAAQEPVEVVYARWRRWPDVALSLFYLLGATIPAAIALAQYSLCLDHPRLRPYSSAIRLDPWYNTMPCTSQRFLDEVLPEPSLSYTKFMREHSPTEHLMWFVPRWWWICPYTSLRYGFFVGGSFLIYAPGVWFLPLLLPDWWHRGGRTLWLSLWRVWVHLGVIVEMTLLDGVGRYHAYDLWEPPSLLMMVDTIKRGLVGTVPWRWHWKVTVVEVVLCVLGWMSRYAFGPTAWRWAWHVATCSCLGGAVSLSVSLLETAMWPYLCCQGAMHSFSLRHLSVATACRVMWHSALGAARLLGARIPEQVWFVLCYALVLLAGHAWTVWQMGACMAGSRSWWLPCDVWLGAQAGGVLEEQGSQ